MENFSAAGVVEGGQGPLGAAAAVLGQIEGLPTSTKTLLYMTTALAGYVAYEQISFQFLKKGKGGALPGPGFVTPILGGLLTMVKDPYGFWETQRLYNPNGLSWNSIVGKFCVFATNTDTIRKIFAANSPDSLLLVLHPNGRLILGGRNIAFQYGEQHKALRNSFLTLFSPKALGKYLNIQEKAIHKHMGMWFKQGHIPEMRVAVRDLNLETSQSVFVGPYLADPVAFSKDYLLMTEGFLSLPIPLPGTGLWKAIMARRRVVKVLEQAVRDSRKNMLAGEEPQCLLDFWMERVLEEVKDAESKSIPRPVHASDNAMAETMMDFLFASQDASTASLTWVVALMADRPDVLERVREEQKRLRPNNEDITYDVLTKMDYTRMVVKEILRYRPPAPMVPQLVQKDFPLADGFVAPKGSVVIPSILAACAQGYTDGEKFDPDRMGPERGEDTKYAKHFLVFGSGPHKCVGYQYAINHLMTFLATMATGATWERTRTARSDEILYLPTIYPHDCIVDIKAKSD
eukprot:comp22579_c0_seq1/m.34497 comp22579_c0_seq1/g.34497  ORF comp22579_c0_seq1/g.34497 comp22579_c0_seq1/m.34497 type:complete len:517 (-) comp22579_c0_seq1:40-1590(-)